jgi:hypothetical protein
LEALIDVVGDADAMRRMQKPSPPGSRLARVEQRDRR